MAFPSWLRPCAALCFAAGLLGLASGCHRGSGLPAGTINVSGTVAYTRTPVVYDKTPCHEMNGEPARMVLWLWEAEQGKVSGEVQLIPEDKLPDEIKGQ